MQINRLFGIIYIMLEKKTVTAAELSKKFEVSVRTIYRDIETLSQSGIPVYMSKGKGGGISLISDFILNKAVLTEQEKEDILSSLKAVNAVNFTRGHNTLEKLDSMLGSSGSDWIEVNFSSWGNYLNESENFSELKKAILQKRSVKFVYESVKSENTNRDVLPLKLVFKGSAWYLYGFCRKRNDYRFFKLRRISNLKITDEIFSMSSPEINFNESEIFKGESVNVKLEISSKMAFRVYDEMSDFSIMKNGDFLCNVDMPDNDTMCRYIISFGEYCKVIEPESLRNEVKQKIQDMLKNYL